MLYLLKFIVFIISISFAQIQYGGSPRYLFNDSDIEIHNVDQTKKIDHNLHPMVLHYADEYSIKINIIEQATIIQNANETIYYIGIQSSGAKAISLKFDNFYLTDQSELYIYSADRSMFIGSFNSKNNNNTESLETAVVKGDQVFIELKVPTEDIDKIKLTLESIMHDFKDLMNFHETSNSNREDCNDNVACSSADDWADQVNSVVLVSGNGGVCSAAIVNNTSQDLTPYILYAAHCNSGGSSVVYFDYQSNSCSGSSPGSYNTMSGTQNLAIGSFNNNDYALIRLNNNIPSYYDVYYAGWNRSSSNPGNNVVGIHHPDGYIKKISYNAYGMSSNGNNWDFAYSDGRVIPGSSGSPFFDSNKYIRGMASYIYTNYCNNSPDCYCSQTYYHGYAKFSSAWSNIDQWLDPLNTNQYTLDGTYDGLEVVEGCTDDDACNYNSDANTDDGSCDYGITCWDGSVECNVNDCPDNSSAVTLSFGQQYAGSFEIIIDTPEEIGGFQFNVNDNPNDITITGASGGMAEESGFTVSTNENGTILGFSFTGGYIPVGQHVLTNISYSGGSNGPELCLSDVVISDVVAEPLYPQTGDCVSLSGSALLSFGSSGSGYLEIFMSNSVPVAGFQFDIIDSPDDIILTNANGGIASELGWTVSTSESGTVLGFSFDGVTIPASDGDVLLTSISIAGDGNPEVCIENGVVSNAGGQGLSVLYGDCATAILSEPGDLNYDGIVNVLDIITLVNIVLGDSTDLSGDLNSDGIVNVLDIITLVNLVLG
tara:strand:+ start:568 stop:2874 length:2307 start_codon:yes stop_codon:yes gene_type:complete